MIKKLKNFRYQERKKSIYLATAAIGIALLLIIFGLVLINILSNTSSIEENQSAEAEPNLIESFEEISLDDFEIMEQAEGITSDSAAGAQNGGIIGGNCTSSFGPLMLINPVFIVDTNFIATRASQLIDLTAAYGIVEGNPGNGRPLLDAEAGAALNEMLTAYRMETGGTLETRSCFRPQGTNCGRLCFKTGTSDHHTGYTCDLVDPRYGDILDTDLLPQHLDWQWLKANSYRFGFIDRFPAEWAGGSMAEPININAQGSTGLYEAWHYRYVGVGPATEIATGVYNGGRYDSLEHYLLATGRVLSLTEGKCAQ